MKKLLASAAGVVVALGLAAPVTAAEVPCETAQLIVPWKAGGGTHVIFSIFEKTIAEMDIQPKIQVVTVPGQGGNQCLDQEIGRVAAATQPQACMRAVNEGGRRDP